MSELDRSAQPRGWLTLLLGALVFAWITASMVFIVWSRSRPLSVAYDIARAQLEEQRLLDEERLLELELTSRRAPARMARLAARRIGLRPLRPGELIRLPPEVPAGEVP